MTPSLARKSSAIFAFWKKPQKPKISESDILLPTEIWLYILDLIPEIALDSISRASKRLRFIALPLFFRSQQIFPFQDTFAYRRISMSAHSELSPDGYQERSIQRLKFLGTTLISSAIRDFYVSPYPPGYNRRHRVEHKPVEAIMDQVVRILPRLPSLTKLVLHLPLCHDALRASLRQCVALHHLELEMPSTSTGEIPIPARKEFLLQRSTSPVQLFLQESLSLVLLYPDSIERIVSGPTGTETIARTLLHHPQGLGSLQVLDLSLRFVASPHFASALAACPALTSLRLRSSPIDGPNIPSTLLPLSPATIPLLQSFHGPASYAPTFAQGRPLCEAYLWTSHGVSTVQPPDTLLAVVPFLPATLTSLSIGVTHLSPTLLDALCISLPALQVLSVNAHLDTFHPGTVMHHILHPPPRGLDPEVSTALPAALLPLRALRELRIGAQLADGGASLEALFGAAREVIGTFPEGYDPTSWRRWVVDRPWSCVTWVRTGREEVGVQGSDVDAGLQEPVQGDLLVEYGEHYFKNFDRGSRISRRTLGILRLSS